MLSGKENIRGRGANTIQLSEQGLGSFAERETGRLHYVCINAIHVLYMHIYNIYMHTHTHTYINF